MYFAYLNLIRTYMPCFYQYQWIFRALFLIELLSCKQQTGCFDHAIGYSHSIREAELIKFQLNQKNQVAILFVVLEKCVF